MSYPNMTFEKAKQVFEDRRTLDTNGSKALNIKLIKKILTFKYYVNKLFRIRQRTEFKKINHNATAIHNVFKNKTVITISSDIPFRLNFKC